MEDVGYKSIIKMNRDSVLGEGGYGTVYKGLYGGSDCAVKRIQIQKRKESASKNLLKELDIMKSVDHKNIVEYFFHDQNKDFYFIAMELCKCSMYDYIGKHGYGALENDLLTARIMYQCTSGVEYLHRKKIIHRDIKPANMLLSLRFWQVNIKLTDFGISKVLAPNKTSTEASSKGTLGYRAAEVVFGLRHKRQSDIFSLGIVLHELSTAGSHPFSKTNRMQAEVNIYNKKEPDLSKMAEKSFMSLITDMLSHNPDQRPIAAKVLSGLRECFSMSDDQLGKSIESSILFPEEKTARSVNKYLRVEDADNAEHRREYMVKAVSDVLNDENVPPPAKSRKSEVWGENDWSIARKTSNNDSIGQLVTNYVVPKRKRKSDTPNTQLMNAELSIRQGNWQEANDFLDRAIELLKPMRLVRAQSLFDLAKEADSKTYYIMSVLLYFCSASQFRRERLAHDGVFSTGTCVHQICETTKHAVKAATTDESLGIDVRYTDIAVHFVTPLVTRECAELKIFGRSNYLPSVAVTKNYAYAVSWFVVLLNELRQFRKAAELAETSRKQLSPYVRVAYRTYTRLLQEEAKAKTELQKYDESGELLEEALKITNRYEKDKEQLATTVHFINKAIERNKTMACWSTSTRPLSNLNNLLI